MYSIANLQSTQYSVLFYFNHSFMKTISLQHMLLKHSKPVDVVIIFFIYFWQTAIGVDSKLLFAFQHRLTALFKKFYQCTIKKKIKKKYKYSATLCCFCHDPGLWRGILIFGELFYHLSSCSVLYCSEFSIS